MPISLFLPLSLVSCAALLLRSLPEFSDEYISSCFKVSFWALKSNRDFPGSIQYLPLSTSTSVRNLTAEEGHEIQHTEATPISCWALHGVWQELCSRKMFKFTAAHRWRELIASFKISFVFWRIWITTATRLKTRSSKSAVKTSEEYHYFNSHISSTLAGWKLQWLYWHQENNWNVWNFSERTTWFEQEIFTWINIYYWYNVITL